MAANVKTLEISRTQAISYAQSMFEIQGLSLRDVAKNIGVSKPTIEKWIKKYNWRAKGVDLPKVTQLTQEKFIEQMAEQGLTSDKVASAIFEGINKPVKEIKNKFDDKLGEFETVEVEDYATRHKYVNSYLNIAGLVGNNGKAAEVNIHGGEGGVQIMVNLPEKSG